MNDWMIYGATGYTGRLIAETAVKQGLKPILAGRNATVVAELGRALGLETRAFDLNDPAAIATGLTGMRAVLHCAGPFSRTFKPMLDACLLAGAHYLDITGELAILEALHARDAELRQAKLTAVSAMGFDVVPTDCLAALLKRALPAATSLRLAIKAPGTVTAGTAKTMIEGVAAPAFVRKGGVLATVPAGHRTLEVPFGGRPSLAVAITLGDVASAYHSTGIPDIETFVGADAGLVAAVRLAGVLGPLLGLPPVQEGLKQLAIWFAKGPSAEALETEGSVVWGEVEDAAGHKVAMRLHAQQPYALTAAATLLAIQRLLAGGIPVGAGTPSSAFGADFVLDLPGTRLERLPA